MRAETGSSVGRNGKWLGPRRHSLLWVLLVMGLTFVAWGTDVQASASGGNDGVRVISADVTGVVLEVTLESVALAPLVAPDGKTYTQVSVEGFELVGLPGHPMLPARSFLLAVPPDAELRLTTTVLADQISNLATPLYPASDWTYDEAAQGGVREVFVSDAAAYASTELTPTALAALEDAGVMRGVRLARLTLQPVQYHAVNRALHVVSHMRVDVQFVGGAATTASRGGAEVSGFTDVIRQTVINPDYVTAWVTARSLAATAAAPSSAPGLPLDRTRYRITLQETGFYQLTYGDLLAAGISVATLDPRLLSVYQGDQELAITVEGEADGRFDPDDVVRFYAARVESLYTETNLLWLVTGEAPGRRMVTRSVAPLGGTAVSSFRDTQHFEVNRVYRSAMPMASDVDHWYWGQMFIVGAARGLTMTIPFTVTDPLPAGTATLTIELWGASSDARVAPDHRVRVSVNGAAIGEVQWDGAVRTFAAVSFDQALLQSGSNMLTLFTPADTGARDAFNRLWEVNWLNFFRLAYERSLSLADEQIAFTAPAGSAGFTIGGWTDAKSLAYDVTDPAAPVQLEGAVMFGVPGSYVLHLFDAAASAGGRYFVLSPAGLRPPLAVAADAPSGLRVASDGADYLIIAHGDFLAGVDPLLAHRRSQGLRARAVDVQDVYDEFSGGLLDPHAIRDFIAYAYAHWPAPAPKYVVLVGDGTYDFMDREGNGAKTFVPPFLAAVDPLMGETAADNRYVAVDGDDIMPDLHLGRLPVNTQEELSAMVNKIIAYEAMPEPGAWRQRAVFVADNPDAAGQFGVLSDAAAAYLPPEYEIQRIYLGSTDYPVAEAARTQQATLDAFNAGALLFNYVGHSSVTNWAAELLFGTSALPQVNNGSKWPIILPMTCLEGTYHNPRYAGLAESVVRLSGRGAVASWSPTGQGVASGHDYLHRGFYDALFNWDLYVLGDATAGGLLYLYTSARFADGTPRYRDLIDTYVLLGDPATRIGVAPANLSLTATSTPGPLAAGAAVTYTLRYSNTGSARVKGIEIVADLPDGLRNVAWQTAGPSLSLRAGTALVWDLAELALGASGQITITGLVADQQPGGSFSLEAMMRIRSRWTEVDLADNQSGPLATTLLPADLVLSQVVEPAAPVKMGDLVTFTLSYANLGPVAASGVSLTLPLPVSLDGLRVLQTGPAATLRPGPPYAWDVGALLPGEKGRLTVMGRVPHTLTWSQVSWSVAGHIGATWPDTNPGNNTVAAGNVSIQVGDMFEPDDTPAQATWLNPSSVTGQHAYDTVGDQDWFVFRTQAGMRYLIGTRNLGTNGDTVLFLRDDAGNLLAKNDDAALDTRASRLFWRAPSVQELYIMVTSNNAYAGFPYELQVLELPFSVALPLVSQMGPSGR